MSGRLRKLWVKPARAWFLHQNLYNRQDPEEIGFLCYLIVLGILPNRRTVLYRPKQ